MLAWAVFVLGTAADAWTTDWARRHLRVRELNPLADKALPWLEARIGDRVAEYALKALLWGPLLWALWPVPPLALYLAGAAQFAIAVRNFAVIRRLSP